MTGSADRRRRGERWARRLPVLLLAAVLLVACGSCVAHAVQAIADLPDPFP